MTERELRAALRSVPLHGQRESQERAWRIVRAGHADLALPRRARRRPGAGLVAVCAVALAALVLATVSQPRETLAGWIRQAIGVWSRPAAPTTLAGLPSGKLVVNSSSGPWIVTGNVRRPLGPYTAAQLSPHGRFVLVWRGSELAVVTLHGAPQWSLPTPAPVKLGRWSPDGYRVAYVAGSSLRVVAGDGSGEHDLVDGVTSVAPAWQPDASAGHPIAVVDSRGLIQLRDADSGQLIWRRRPPGTLHQLLWSPDGQLLAAVAARRLILYNAAGGVLASWPAPLGERLEAAAFAPASARIAVVLRSRTPTADSVKMLLATPAGLRRAPELLLSLREKITDLAWSPDGRWLLAPSPSADQWTLIHTRAPFNLRSVSHVSSRFDATGAKRSAPPQGAVTFPALAGWEQ